MRAYLLLGLLLVGCKKEEAPAPPPAPIAPPAAPVVPDAAPQKEAKRVELVDADLPDGGVVAPGETARLCPSAVSGAKTAVRDVPGAVEVTVTGGDTDEIRRRAQKLIEAKQIPPSAQMQPSGDAACPIILDDTVVTVAEVDGGARLTVKPVEKAQLGQLAAETRRRAAALR